MLIWKGFESNEKLLVKLKRTFENFTVMFPEAAKYLIYVNGNASFLDSFTAGQFNVRKAGIDLKLRLDNDDVDRTFVHELGHLLHLYLENSSVANIIYKFTTKNRPRKRWQAPSEYALQDRLEAFAEGFMESWFCSDKSEWSIYTRKLVKMINILKLKSISLINRVWRFFGYNLVFPVQTATIDDINIAYFSGTATTASTFVYAGTAWC